MSGKKRRGARAERLPHTVKMVRAKELWAADAESDERRSSYVKALPLIPSISYMFPPVSLSPSN
jgi:hypothetical protein